MFYFAIKTCNRQNPICTIVIAKFTKVDISRKHYEKLIQWQNMLADVQVRDLVTIFHLNSGRTC